MEDPTLQKIKTIEERAAATVKEMRQRCSHLIKTASDRHALGMAGAAENMKNEGKALLQKAEAEAKAEAREIEAAFNKEAGELHKKVNPQIESARKEILRCLS